MKIIDVIGEIPSPDSFINPEIRESEKGTRSVWRILPDGVLLKGHNPFFVPDFPGGISAMPVAVIKICKLGKNIPARFGSRHYIESAPGIIFRAEKYAEQLRAQGLPDTPAYVFDKALIVGDFRPHGFPDSFSLELKVHGQESSASGFGNQSEWSGFEFRNFYQKLHDSIQSVSRDNTLKIGDLFLINGDGKGVQVQEDTKLSVCKKQKPEISNPENEPGTDSRTEPGVQTGSKFGTEPDSMSEILFTVNIK